MLFRDDKEGEPRYASSQWLKRLAATNSSRSMRLAGHLCAQRVNELLRGESDFVRYLHEEVGFNRVQINATAANNCDVAMFGSDSGACKCVAALRSAFAAVPEVEFILQRNRETKALWERLVYDPPPNITLLIDDSMGLGDSATSWPSPRQVSNSVTPAALAHKPGAAAGEHRRRGRGSYALGHGDVAAYKARGWFDVRRQQGDALRHSVIDNGERQRHDPGWHQKQGEIAAPRLFLDDGCVSTRSAA